MLLVRGNSKLSKAIYSFDIPARKTCPGSTPTCRKICYAASGRFRTHKVQRRLHAAWDASKKAAFPDVIEALIASEGVTVLRVHSSGDLYSVDYARKWLKVMRNRPGTVFYLYTRSWRKSAFRPVLKAMARLPNVRLWFSCDRDTGVPGRARVPEGVRLCYLATTEDDTPARADLVFRSHALRKTPAARVPDAAGKPVLVCPTETGLPGAKAVTCGTCGLCWRPAQTQAGRVPLTVL